MKKIFDGIKSLAKRTYIFWLRSEINEAELARIKEEQLRYRLMYLRH